jgi:hypothetical protein
MVQPDIRDIPAQLLPHFILLQRVALVQILLYLWVGELRFYILGLVVVIG